MTPMTPPNRPRADRRALAALWIAIVLAVAIVAGAAFYTSSHAGFLLASHDQPTTTTPPTTAPPTAPPTTAPPTTTPPTTPPPTTEPTIPPGQRVVPDVVGADHDDAMRATGIVMVASFDCHRAPAGTIVAQDPAPGTLVPVHASMTVAVQDPECRVVPDLIGEFMPHAEPYTEDHDERSGHTTADRLREAGFDEWHIRRIQCGYVIAEMSPAPGTDVRPDEVDLLLFGPPRPDGPSTCV